MRFTLIGLVLLGCNSAEPATSQGSPDLSSPSSLPDLSPPPPGSDLSFLGSTNDMTTALTRHMIAPNQTDPSINSPNDPHIAIAPAGLGNGLILVFMPGTGGVPTGYDDFLNFAGSVGFHVIGLDYPDNAGTVSSVCNTDLACYEKLRIEVWSGQDTSDKVTVDANNCIHNRLTKLLQYLVTEYPNEGWDPFYYMGDAAWNKLVISGHSQGGGHAAYIASVERVARVVMFSSVSDASPATSPPTPAPWIATHLTPTERYFGMDHMNDSAYHTKIVADYSALGMDTYGAMADVDTVQPPYGNTHELTGSRTLTSPHNQVVGDSVPLVNGVPVYQPMWQYILGN